MLSCLKSLPPSSTNNYLSSPASQAYSVEETPRSNAQPSPTPTINLTEEYTLVVQTTSYGEIRRTFDQDGSYYADQNAEIEQVDSIDEPQLLDHVLQPSRECVQETLSLIKPNPLTQLVATYFEHSENTCRLCFLLYQSIRRARQLYTPIHNLLEDLPLDFDSDSYSLSDSLCKLAHNAFLQFDSLENPFLSPDTKNFDDMRQHFSHLKQQLDHHLKKSKSKSKSRVRLGKHYFSSGPALCLIAGALGVALSAVAIATHSVAALVGSPIICLAIFPSDMTKGKETAHLAQLDSAAMNAYVLHKDLDTVDRLIAHLYSDVENDKLIIHVGLERDMDGYLIQEILKQLRRNRTSFVQRLLNLEEHLFLSFAAINRTRSRLLQEIHSHQNTG
ncbi:hypothetical protein ABFS82_12G153700 [Erythranthe guttata]